jgi:two-component system LytT family sensor kinase
MAEVLSSQAKAIRYPGIATLLVAWTVLGGLAYVRRVLLADAPHDHVLSHLAGWMMSYYPWVVLTPLVFRLEHRFVLSRSKWPRHLPWLALAGLPLAYLGHEISVGLNIIAELTFRLPWSRQTPWWSVLRCEFLMQQALYWFAVGGACVIRNVIERQQGERKAAQLALEKSELESSLRLAEIDTLRMRLNPHFLFNSLQNISSLTRQDPGTASQMLTRLGDLLRSTLRKGTQAETSLAAEIALTKAYVSIEQMRFADRLSILFDIEGGLEGAMIPSFLLQPLVENAINHGLRGAQKTGVILIRSMRQVNQLVLTVSDNGIGPPTERLADLEMGIGLGSTCERLQRMYADRHSLSMQKLPEGGTEVRIALPLRLQEVPSETPAHELTSIAHR